MECTRCLCDKPHHCTCIMLQASTWLTPQGDRVQRIDLYTPHVHTPPLSVRHGTRFRALHAWISRRTHTHTMSRHYRVSTNARRLCTRHSLLYMYMYKLYKDRRSILLQKRTDTKPLPPNDQFLFLKKCR